MQTLRPAIIAMLLATSSLAAPMTPAFAQSCTCGGGGGGVSVGIQAEEPPPPLPVYEQPPIPAAGYLWTPGYWNWNNEDYYWVPGTWIEPPHPGLLWTPGYWGFAGGVYLFNRGYWGPHIGFYGGISYGFGYTGSGFFGGRWNDGVFFYNRSVNNVTNVRITNVYNETVVNNVTNNRVSFNGGAGGIAAKPTAEEELAAKETHEQPTPQQIHNVRAASLNEGSFASVNRGKPLVAATPRPGVLKGPGIVKASAAPAPATSTPASEEKPKGEAAPGNPPEKPAGEPKPKSEAPALRPAEEAKPKSEAPAMKPAEEAKPKREAPAMRPAEEAKPKREAPAMKPAEEAKPKREAPAMRPAEESRPKPEAPKPRPAEEARPKPDRPAGKPEGGEKKPDCGHPGQPACK
jgi:hypothetical protein